VNANAGHSWRRLTFNQGDEISRTVTGDAPSLFSQYLVMPVTAIKLVDCVILAALSAA